MITEHQPPADTQPLAICRRDDDPCAVCRGVSGMRVMPSEELLQGCREVLILHAGQIYRLSRTKNDKLILQK